MQNNTKYSDMAPRTILWHVHGVKPGTALLRHACDGNCRHGDDDDDDDIDDHSPSPDWDPHVGFLSQHAIVSNSIP